MDKGWNYEFGRLGGLAVAVDGRFKLLVDLLDGSSVFDDRLLDDRSVLLGRRRYVNRSFALSQTHFVS